MGFGFVLFACAIIGTTGALLAGSALAAAAALFLRAADRQRRRRVIALAFAFPFAAGAYVFAGFLGYAAWCELVRGVDPALGDVEHVPLGAGYSLVMIDTEDNPFVETPTGESLTVTRLGVDPTAIYGRTWPAPEFFLVDKRVGTLQRFSTEAEFLDHARDLGVMAPALQVPQALYRSIRWGLGDILAGLLLVGPPAAVGLYLLRRLARLRRITLTAGVARSRPGLT